MVLQTTTDASEQNNAGPLNYVYCQRLVLHVRQQLYGLLVDSKYNAMKRYCHNQST